MFFKTFMTAAVIGFVAALIAGAAVLPEHLAPEARTVDFTTAPSSASGSDAPIDALDAAWAHAEEHQLTDCVDPAQARLDDVVLTFPHEPLAGDVITPVDFDGALESGELGRWNVLACKAAAVVSGDG